jgi:hypothetical protein
MFRHPKWRKNRKREQKSVGADDAARASAALSQPCDARATRTIPLPNKLAAMIEAVAGAKLTNQK